MKPRSSRRFLNSPQLRSFNVALTFASKALLFAVACSLGAVSLSPFASAASFTYDADNTTPTTANDGAGLGWDTTTANWFNGATDVVWPNSISDTAIFGAASTGIGGSVTVGTVNVGTISFAPTTTTGYTLSGGTITLGTGINYTNGVGSTISAKISGSNGLAYTGVFQSQVGVTLSGANDYTGITTISTGGRITASSGTAFGSSAGATASVLGANYTRIDANASAVVSASTSEAFLINGNGSIASGNGVGALRITSGTTLSSLVQLGSNATITGNFSSANISGNLDLGAFTLGIGNGNNTVTPLTVSGQLLGSGILDISSGGGSNTVNLTNNGNTFSGTVRLNSSGFVGLGGNTVLGTSTLAFNGGAVQSTSATARTVSNAISLNTNAVFGPAPATTAPTNTGALTFTNTTLTSLGGNRTFTTNVNTSFANGFSGAFNLSKVGVVDATKSPGTSGTGSLILRGSSTYTGTTTISVGTLVAKNGTALGNAVGNNVTVATGAGLSYAASTDTALSIGGTLGVTGGTGTTLGGSIGSTTTSARINVTGNATATGAVSVNVFGLNSVSPATGTYTLVQGNGAANTLNGATYTLGTVFNNTNFTVATPTATTGALTVAVTSQTALTTAFWKGGLTGSTNVWAASNGSTASNWLITAGGSAQALVPGATTDVTFSATSPTTTPTATVLGSDMIIKSLTIADTATAFGLVGDAYTLTLAGTGGITVNATGRVSTLSTNLIMGGAQTWTNSNTGTTNVLTVNGNVDNGGFLLTGAGAGNINLNGTVSGTGGLTATGAGIVTIAGANTYSGATTINSGATLSLGGSGSGTPTATNSGSLATTSTLTNNGNLTINRNNIVTQGTDFTASAITGSGSLTQAGSGTTFLTAANSYSGSTSVNAGILNAATLNNGGAGNNSAIGAATNVAGNLQFGGGTLQYTGSTAQTTDRLFTLNTGGGTLDASGSVSGAKVSFTNTGALNTGSGTTARTLTLTGSNVDANTLASTLGTGTSTISLVKNGTGTWVLSGANTYTGTTSVTAGTLNLTGSLGTNGGTGSNVSTSGSGIFTESAGGVINGAGATFTQASSGTSTLSGANTYTGATVVNAGTLVISGSIQTVTNNVGVNNAGILTFGDGTSTNGSAPVSGTIFVSNTGTVNLNKTTGGTLSNQIASNPGAVTTLSGTNAMGTTNTFSGVEYSNGGSFATNSTTAGAVLAFSGASPGAIDLQSTNLTVGGAGDTLFTSAGTGIYSSTTSGNTVTKNGTGTLIYQGNQGYTGTTAINAGAVRLDVAQTNGGTYFVGNAGTTTTAASLFLGGGSDGTAGGVTFNRNISENSGSGGNRVIGGTNTGGTNAYTGTVTLTDSNATLQAAAGGIVSFDTITASSVQSVAVGASGKTGTIQLGGTADNLNVAATVNFGTLELNKTSSASVHALGSLLTINSGATAKITGTGGDQIFDSANATVSSGGVLDLNGQSETVNILTLNGTGISSGGALINNNGSTTSTLTASGGIVLGASSSMGGSANIATSSVISGSSMDLTKVGTGTVTLGGSNTYTGTTTISAGTLSINGNQSTATGAVAVNSTGTLKGIGTIGGAVTISGLSGSGNQAIHAAGNSVGLQAVANDLSYGQYSIFEWELASNTETGRGTNFDAVDLTGVGSDLTIDETATTGAVFKVVLGVDFNTDPSFWSNPHSWDVFHVAGANTTQFTNFQLFNASAPTTPVDFSSSGAFTYSFASGSGSLNWSAVPEPTSALAGLLLGLGLLRRRRSA